MRYYLARRAVLKWLEIPSIYQITKDELYELDDESFLFLKDCSAKTGCASKDGAFVDYCMEEGLVTTEKVSLPRPNILQAPQPSLRYLELQITDVCNLRCKHCYINGNGENELTVKQIGTVLTEFQEMQGLRVLITGGEPLLHRKFDEINEMLPDFFVRKVLLTNGLLLKKEDLTTLKVDEIQVSIDGLEQANDHVRGRGTFRRAMETVKHALNAGFDVSISTMVHKENLTDFDGMERLFKGMGIKDWTVDVPCITGRLRENTELQIRPEQGGKYLGYGYGEGLHQSGEGYGCGLHLMAVLANGAIAKCAFYGDRSVGTVDNGLRAAWQKTQPVRLKELACDCQYLEVCRGGCRYRAELLQGKNGKDPYRCMLYGIL